jgi:hypothetical protein
MRWYMCIVGHIHKVNKKKETETMCCCAIMLVDVNSQGTFTHFTSLPFSLGEPNDRIIILDATSV